MINLQELFDTSEFSFKSIGDRAFEVALIVLIAIVVFLLFWVLGAIIGKIIEHLIKASRLNEGLSRIGFKEVWERSGHKLDTPMFFNELVKWFFIIVGLAVATDILNLEGVTSFLLDVVVYLPNVFVAAFALLIGLLVASFVERVIAASVKAAKLSSAHILSSVAKWSIIVFSILIALEQLQVGSKTIEVLQQGIIIAVALALGLAFGLGGKDHANDIISNVRKHIKE